MTAAKKAAERGCDRDHCRIRNARRERRFQFGRMESSLQKKDQNGQVVVTRYNPDLLERGGRRGRGIFVRAD